MRAAHPAACAFLTYFSSTPLIFLTISNNYIKKNSVLL